MNRFENMQNFIKVVEAGNITAAAERLGIAKSAVSRRLKELESHLGAELFHRTTRRMTLTDTGRIFYHQSVQILEQVLEAELSTSQAHGVLQGRLKVAIPLSFGLLHMDSAINDFLQLHPQIKFELDLNDREINLVQEGFDMAIRIANLPDSTLIARRLTNIKLLICASPDYLKEMGTPKKLADLTQHRCLLYNLMRDSNVWQLNNQQGVTEKVKLTPYMNANSGDFLKEAALAGNGIVMLPTFMTYQDLRAGRLIPLLTRYQPLQLNAYAIYPQTRHLSRRVRAFIDFLATRFTGTPYWDQ